MSERYCDRDANFITSSDIIRKYYFREKHLLFPTEIPLLEKYLLCEKAYLNLLTSVGMYGASPYRELSKEQALDLMEGYKRKLAELEDSTEMRNFFCHIKEKEFIMLYGNRKK